ncbi:hypothetical protein BFP78_13865 [Gaetbulibacter sp. 5U11]|nr:hypothetical protein BFP78_13865 [Gaetbulibacter sp. 5U11]
MNKPLVSIIVPTYNKVLLAIETLESIAAQTYKQWECIIVDDGSKIEEYNTILNFTKTDRRFTLYKRPSNKPKGANACRNYGMALSKGDYIQFFDNDDIMLPHCIAGRVEELQASTLDFVVFSMDIFDGNQVYVNSDQIIVSNWQEALDEFLSERRLPWNLQRVLFKSKLIKGRISFNEELLRFQDGDFNIRVLTTLQPKFKLIIEVDSRYRMPSKNNPRSQSFYLNVFKSMPIYIQSVSSTLTKDQKQHYQWYFQNWLYAVIGLYTRPEIDYSKFLKAYQALKNNYKISIFKRLILKALFLNKRYLKGIKGHVLLSKWLNKWYGAKTTSSYQLNKNRI